MSQRPFFEELGEVMSEVWHGSPVEFDDNGDEIVTPPGLAVVWAEVRAEVREAWRAYRGGAR